CGWGRALSSPPGTAPRCSPGRSPRWTSSPTAASRSASASTPRPPSSPRSASTTPSSGAASTTPSTSSAGPGTRAPRSTPPGPARRSRSPPRRHAGPTAPQLVVRAALRITDQPLEGDRPAYAGTVEQVAADVADTGRAGAHETILCLQGDHGLDTALDVYARIAEAVDVTPPPLQAG